MCAENKQTISSAGVAANIVIFIVIVLGVNGTLMGMLTKCSKNIFLIARFALRTFFFKQLFTENDSSRLGHHCRNPLLEACKSACTAGTGLEQQRLFVPVFFPLV